MLKRLRASSIEINAFKCHFAKERCDPADTAALEKYREPLKTIGELRSLLGFFGYYRCYAPDFSKTMKPLYDMLPTKDKDGNRKKNVKTRTNGKQIQDSRFKIYVFY